MNVEMRVCDYCRAQGKIRPATGYVWDKQLGRIFDVCVNHANFQIKLRGTVGYYAEIGDMDARDSDGLFELLVMSEFAELGQYLFWDQMVERLDRGLEDLESERWETSAG